MTYEKYVIKYKKFLEKWQALKSLNECGDFSCGAAIYGPSCDCIVVFDNDEQKTAYQVKFGF